METILEQCPKFVKNGSGELSEILRVAQDDKAGQDMGENVEVVP